MSKQANKNREAKTRQEIYVGTIAPVPMYYQKHDKVKSI